MIKHILAAAVIVPFLTVSGMAQDVPLVSKHIYVGGPASNIPHTTRQLSAYQAYAMAPKSSVRHVYLTPFASSILRKIAQSFL